METKIFRVMHTRLVTSTYLVEGVDADAAEAAWMDNPHGFVMVDEDTDQDLVEVRS